MRPGIYRRRIQIRTEPGRAYALLEDDPHCYRVSIQHDGNCVKSATGEAIRVPWETCAQARHQLARLTGMPLSDDVMAARDFTDPAQQCTHMFDAAALAIAHAARGIAQRQYDISVECWSFEGPRRVQMSIDEIPAFDGVIDNQVFIEPASLRGTDTKSLYQRARQNRADADELEAMWIVRRAIYISGNRRANLDDHQFAVEVNPGFGACYVYQPGIAENARRVVGSTRDFTDEPERMLHWDSATGN